MGEPRWDYDKLLWEYEQLKAELKWWHELIEKHHKNRTCPDLKTYIENLQAENKRLREALLKAKGRLDNMIPSLNRNYALNYIKQAIEKGGEE